MLKGTDWVGCLDSDSPGNASYSALKLISYGIVYSTVVLTNNADVC